MPYKRAPDELAMKVSKKTLENIVNGKVFRLERHIERLSHEKDITRNPIKIWVFHWIPLNTFHAHLLPPGFPLPHVPPGVLASWSEVRQTFSARTYSQAAVKVYHDLIDSEILIRQNEIKTIKEAIAKVEKLPEEKQIPALNSFVDLYKDYKEPILTEARLILRRTRINPHDHLNPVDIQSPGFWVLEPEPENGPSDDSDSI